MTMMMGLFVLMAMMIMNTKMISLTIRKLAKRELCPDRRDLKLLRQLVKFLKPFQNLTEVASGGNFLSILPLVKHKITSLFKHNADYLSVIKQLKTACSTKVETRLKLSQSAIWSCLLHPAVKVIFLKEEVTRVLMKAISNITERSVSDDANNAFVAG